MTKLEMATALGAYLAALGVPPPASAFCIPILAGAKPVPTAFEAALAEDAATAADGKTMTLVQAGERMGVSRSTIYRLTRDGTLPTVNVRGKNRIRLGDLKRAFALSAPSASTTTKEG